MKLNSKRKTQTLKKEEQFKTSQYNQLMETFKGKKPINIIQSRIFSPEASNKEIILMKNFNNGLKKPKPKFYPNSSINNSSNSIHIKSILGKSNNQFFLDKFKHQTKNKTTEIEISDYMKTEPTPTSTANTTNMDSIIRNKNHKTQKSYNKMIENMMKSKFISSSLKSIKVFKNRNMSSYQQTPSSKILCHHSHTKDKSSFFISDDNTIDKDIDEDNKVESNSITYTDLIRISDYPSTLSLDVLSKNYDEYPKAIELNKQIGYIKGYGVNTYKGLIKKDNEDRVSIIQNVPKPKGYKGNWPCCFLLGVYDGHGGKTCANYLKDHLLNCIIKNNHFPNEPITAIEKGFEKVENDFLYEKCLNRNNNNNSTEVNEQLIDSSGSCSIVIVFIDKICHIANLGDSRALVSINKGQSFEVLSIDHSPSNNDERKRIELNGGTIYQTKLSLNQFMVNEGNKNTINDHILYGPDRILPGNLTISRSIGDPKAKLSHFGGKSNVIIAKPSIISYEITPESDFIIIGSDGLFEQMTNKEIIDAIWLIRNNTNNNISLNYSQCADLLIKTSLERKTIDNITAVIINLKPKPILTPPQKTSIKEMQLELANIFETIDQKNCQRKQHKSPLPIKAFPYTVKRNRKNKHIMTLNQ